MSGSILYCGDTELNGAASYLAGLMTAWGWDFDYVPSHQAITKEQIQSPRSLLILSDYMATQFNRECQTLVVEQIARGSGLLMIGGWESFHGFGGDWDGTPIGEILPVKIQPRDDRMNFDQSAYLSITKPHPITENLPWASRPPAIGGMNRVVAKTEANLLVEAQTFVISRSDLDQPATAQPWSFSRGERFPALVTGVHGHGRTAAFMSDVAPHWVGGFVDWGLPRVTGQAKNGPGIEVGHFYAQFWKQLLEWTKTQD
jgi:uncharacterized membrane protein